MMEDYQDQSAGQDQTYGAGYYGYQPKNDKADLLDKIRPEEIVEIIRHRLIGEEFINGKWTKIPSLQKLALSEVGAWEITTLMLPCSSQNVSLSRLSNDEIRERLINVADTAIAMCLSNHLEYNVKSTAQLQFVNELVMSNTLVTLKQPEHEGIRMLLKGTTHENRLVTSNQGSKQGFASSLFKGWRK